MPFLLEYNGSRRPLKSWGIEGARLQRVSLDADTLSFEIPSRSIHDEPPFPFGAELSLWLDSVCRFRGKVCELPAIIAADRDANRYVVANAWSELASTLFQDSRYVFKNPDDPESAKIVTNNTAVVLFQTLAGILRTNGEQITLALQYAIDHGVELQIGTIDPAIKVPFEEATDVTCAEVIRRSCRYQPDTVSWFDYATQPPTLHLRRRGALSAVTLDLDAASVIISAEPSARYDLQPVGIKLFIERISVTQGKATIWYQEQLAGNATEGPRCIVSTIPCVGTDPDDNYVHKTLAVDFYASLSTLQWEGTIKLGEVECSGLLSPGKVVNLSNGRAAWSTMAALVQETIEDLDSGRTSVKFGPPTQLGAQDFLELARTARLTTVNNNTGRSNTITTGTQSSGNPAIAQATQTFPLKACDSTTGKDTTVWVNGSQ